MSKLVNCKLCLFAHRNRNTTVAAPAPHDAVHSPGSGDGDERRVQITLGGERNAIHLQRNQRRRIASAVHVRLVAWNVGVIHDGGVLNHGVEHRSCREIGVSRLLHCRHRPRRRHCPILPEVYPLRKPQAVLDGAGEFLRHYAARAGSGIWMRRGRNRLTSKVPYWFVVALVFF